MFVEKSPLFLGYNPKTEKPKVPPVRKTRVILFDEKEKYSVIWQVVNPLLSPYLSFAGGKVNESKGEPYGKAGVREVKEETGIDLSALEEKGLLQRLRHVNNYAKNYYHEGSNIQGPHLIETDYYITPVDLEQVSMVPTNPSGNEAAIGLCNFAEDIRWLPYMIDQLETDNPRWPMMKREMTAITLEALVYLDLYKES